MPTPAVIVGRLVASATLGIACVVFAVVNAAPALGQSCLCGTLADEFRAADAGLVREWIVQVPFDSAAARIERVTASHGLVLALSSDGGVAAIHDSGTSGPRPGTVAWSRRIAAAAGHAWPPTIGPSLVVVTSELAVHGLDRRTGLEEWTRPTDSLTAAAATQSGDWVYAPLQTNRILRLPANPLKRLAAEPQQESPAGSGRRGEQAAATPAAPESLDPISIDAGGELDAAPLPLENGVLWSTALGLAALERTPLGWIRHRLPESTTPTWVRQAPLSLAGPPLVRGGSIFIVTVASGVARVDLNAENRPGLRTVWTAALPDAATSGAFVADDVVVVAIGPSGIMGLSAADGRELWRQPLVGTPVAVAGGRAWLLDEVGRLTALDLATGSRRLSTCLGCFSVPVVSSERERLLLASPGGLLVSLAPPSRPAQPRPAAPAPPAEPPVTDDDAPAAADAEPDPDATPP